MQKRPSNALFYVIGSVLLLFNLYIGGNLILQTRQEVAPDRGIQENKLIEPSLPEDNLLEDNLPADNLPEDNSFYPGADPLVGIETRFYLREPVNL